MANTTSLTRNRCRQVLHDWLNRRNAPSKVHTLNYRNLYVLPSSAGCMLGLTLLVLLIASINFQLNLGYLLTFLLAGSALMSVWMGHNNARGVQLQLGKLSPVFQGERATVTVHLSLPAGQNSTRYALALALNRSQGAMAWAHTDVKPQQAATVQLGSVPRKRGWQRLPRLLLETRYPLGIFRIWSYWQPQEQILVYPAPETPMPPIQHSEHDLPGKAPPLQSGHSEHDGVRIYQRGDALRTIVWKKAATALASGSGDLVVRSGHTQQTNSLWLDARATSLTEPEAQIARLTAWVLHAHAQQWEWGLRLPSGLSIPPSQGEEHFHTCLSALATDGHAPELSSS